MNTKTKRRLAILLAGAVLVGGAGGGFVVYRKQRTARLYATWRREGLAAYAAGDYQTALEKLGRYVNRYQTDSETLYACAQTRIHIEEPNHQEVPQAIALLRRFVDLNPDRVDAREQLLDLYLKVGFFTETIATSDEILKYAPKNPKALRSRTFALFYLRRYDECLKTALLYNDIAPLDLEVQSATLTVMQRRGASQDDIIQRADTLLARHPDDSRFELLKSAAFAMTGDRQAAVTWARKSAAHPSADPAFLKILVRQLDTLGLFTEAGSLQEQAAKQNPDAENRYIWISRLVESGHYADVAALLEKDGNDADVNLVVCRIIALAHLNRTSDAQALQSSLAERGKTDARAAAAAAALQTALLHPDDPQKAIAACNDALSSDSQNPFFLFLLAQAYDRSGESELAIDHLQEAAQVAPAWAEPLVAKSKIQMQRGEILEAFVAAQGARNRAPNDPEAMVAAATSAIYLIPRAHTDDFNSLFALVREIEQKFPNEQRVVPVHVLLLSRLGHKDDAVKYLQTALNPQFPATQDMLLSLASASRAAGLGQEEACFSRAEQVSGMTPELAYAKACWFFLNKKPDEGLRYFQEKQSQAHNAGIDWKIDWARYLDLIQDPRAKAEWTALSDANPDNVKIQWLALDAHSTQSDRPFISHTIDRLRALRGDKGTFLSITRAKYILQGNPSEKDAAEAVLLLTDVNRQNPKIPFAHILLASAYEHQGNINSAVEELAIASDLTPDSNPISLNLARLLHQQRDFTRARPYIDRVIHSAAATSDDRRNAAAMLAEEGDFTVAIQQLEQLPPAESAAADKLKLATFYYRLNQAAKLDALLGDLLQHPSPEIIQLAADFYASQNRTKDAERVLALLDAIDCPPALKFRIRAGYLARSAPPEKAIEQYVNATTASPTDTASWRQLLIFCLYNSRMADFDRFAPAAHAAIPADPSFTALNANLPLVHELATDPSLRPIFIAMLTTPDEAPNIADAAQLFVSIKKNHAAADEYMTKLRQVAAHSPNVLAIQILLAHSYLVTGHMDNAVEIATRAMQSFPTSAEAAQVAAETLAGAGRWNEALTVGKQWRDRIVGPAVLADIVIADSYLQLGKPDDALRQIQPYLEISLKHPDENAAVILLYAQGLIISNNMDAAAKLLQPLLTSPRWRAEWIGFALRLPEKQAQSWFTVVEPLVSNSTTAEKLQLAIAFHEFSLHTHIAAYNDKAISLIEAMAAQPDCDSQTLLVLGTMYEARNNLEGAEHVYRRALQIKSDQPAILNNLAMVLLKKKTPDLAEPLSLAAKAIKLQPNVPNFYDTAASIQAEQKAYPDALSSIAAAIKLAPEDPEWQVTRIWLLALSGQRDAALAELHQLKNYQSFSTLSQSSRDRLASLDLR